MTSNNDQQQNDPAAAGSPEFLRIKSLITHPPKPMPEQGPDSLHTQIHSANLTKAELESLLAVARKSLIRILRIRTHLYEQEILKMQIRSIKLGNDMITMPPDVEGLQGDVVTTVLQRLDLEKMVMEMSGRDYEGDRRWPLECAQTITRIKRVNDLAPGWGDGTTMHGQVVTERVAKGPCPCTDS